MSSTPNGDHRRRFVSNAELEERLEKIPTRWEVRALVLGALIASQIVPPGEVARAAISLLGLS